MGVEKLEWRGIEEEIEDKGRERKGKRESRTHIILI
jgi:hypothetical protein